jgi:hypothetical protein
MRYYVTVEDLKAARGKDPAFAWRGGGPRDLVDDIRHALRSDSLFLRWQAAQEEPDEVDQSLGAIDPDADVTGEERAHGVHVLIRTKLPMAVLRHRLMLMLGANWALTDVQA